MSRTLRVLARWRFVEGVCITFVQTRQFGASVPCKSNKWVHMQDKHASDRYNPTSLKRSAYSMNP